MRCIVVGCTSGYKSNAVKVHFFRVPENKNRSEEWQKACRRKDLVLNPSHCFCEHHFAKEEIICKKIFRNKDGEIIQEIPLKRAYLKEGVVPSLFSWTEFGNTGNTESTVTDNADDADNINNICIGESTKHNNYEDISDTLTFNELKCNDKLYVPVGWNRNTFPLENTSVIIFYRMVCKVNDQIKNANWSVFDCFEHEHDYSMPATFDCIIYFITGRICQQLLTFIQCTTCKEAVTANTNNYSAKQKFGDELSCIFVHSNIGFFNFIKKLENLFVQHCHKLDVVDAILNSSIESNILMFPCKDHKVDIISYIVYYFLEIRLSEYCKQLNDNTKNNQHVKKISKYCKT